MIPDLRPGEICAVRMTRAQSHYAMLLMLIAQCPNVVLCSCEMLKGDEMAERDVITAYITKYALTGGIERIKAEVCLDIGFGMITQIEPKTHCGPIYYHKGDWFLNEADAIANAESRRKRKLLSLQRQKAKLEGMDFAVKILDSDKRDE